MQTDWHEKARSLRKQGMGYHKIATLLGVSISTVVAVTSPNWLGTQVTRWTPERRKALGLPEKIGVKEAQEWAEKNEDIVREFMMAHRSFTPVKQLNNGIMRYGLTIRCVKRAAPDCLQHEDFFNSSGRPSHVHAAQTFRNHGWNVGGGYRNDVCPKCMAFLKYKPPVKKETTVEAVSNNGASSMKVFHTEPAKPEVKPEATKEVPLKTDKPMIAPEGAKVVVSLKEVDKTAKRLIDERLDEVYDAAKGGYLKGYTDAKLAEEMNVNRAWVAAVRDFGHGPETTAADISEELKAFDAKMDEWREAKKVVDASIEALTRLDNQVNDRLASFEKLSKEVQALYNAFKTKVRDLS